MPHPPTALPAPSRRRWQFSIRGMLIFTASVAVGLSAMQINKNCWFGSGEVAQGVKDVSMLKTGWQGGMLATLIFWICLSLLYQIRDLRVCLAANTNLPSEQKWGGTFEICWRLCILAMFALFAGLAILLDRGVFILRDTANFLWDPNVLREGIFLLFFLVLVGSIPCVRRETNLSWLKRWLYLVLCIMAVVLCLERWAVGTSFHQISQAVMYQMDSALPNKFSAIDARRYPSSTRLFFWWSIVSGLIVVANGLFLHRLSQQWALGIGRRSLYIGLLLLGIAATSSYVVWTLSRGLREISPYFAEVGTAANWHNWIAAALLLIIVATVWTYRIATDWTPHSNERNIIWRIHKDKYYGEWRTILILLAIILIISHLVYLYQIVIQLGFFSASTMPSFFRQNPILPVEIFFSPLDALGIALILLTFHRIFARRVDPNRPQAGLPRINPAKFLTLWLATAAFVVSGSLALVWMSFGLWFNPWFGGR
jgi:hypothetical protein